MSPARRILVIGPAWVGDMIMAQSLLLMLKADNSHHQIEVVAPPWSAELIERMPEVSNSHVLACGHGELGLAKRWQLGRQLRGRFDQAIVLPRSYKAALLPFFAGITQRTGRAGQARWGLINDPRPSSRDPLIPTVHHYLSLGLNDAKDPLPNPVPQPHLDVDKQAQIALKKRFKLPEAPAIALMPGAEYGPAKQWPLKHFRALAKAIASNQPVLIFGGSKEKAQGEFIAEGLSGVHNLCGQTRLVEALDLIASCDQAVSNDSGLMHLAAATGVTVHAIYGSSSPVRTPPLSSKAKVHTLSLSCSPCFARQCPLGHTRCLNDLEPKVLMQAISQAR